MINASKLIKQERLKKGLTVKELARLSGFSFKTIYTWESGEKNITFKSLERLLETLDMEIIIRKRE